jgi:hypothetical protein
MCKRVVSLLLLVLGFAVTVSAQTFYTVNFQAQSGHYVVAENNGGTYMNADRGSAGSWETFELEDDNGGDLESGDLVYIRTGGGYYVSQTCFAPFQLRQMALATIKHCSSWMSIDKVDNNNNWVSGPIYSGDQVAISGWNGSWQAANGGEGQLLVTGNLGAWEKFFITIY